MNVLRDLGERRGQALVEFALIVPLFVLIAIGIFESARAIYTYNALSNGVTEALREAIVHQDQAAIEAEANNVLGGLAADTDITHDLADCPTPTNPDVPCIYRVELRYQFTPVLIGTIFSPVISADGEMLVESTNP
jgi:Flp pilus assembly protein TadG